MNTKAIERPVQVSLKQSKNKKIAQNIWFDRNWEKQTPEKLAQIKKMAYKNSEKYRIKKVLPENPFKDSIQKEFYEYFLQSYIAEWWYR